MKFFSHLRYAAGMKETDIEIDDGETLIKLIERLGKKFGSDFEDRINDLMFPWSIGIWKNSTM